MNDSLHPALGDLRDAASFYCEQADFVFLDTSLESSVNRTVSFYDTLQLARRAEASESVQMIEVLEWFC